MEFYKLYKLNYRPSDNKDLHKQKLGESFTPIASRLSNFWYELIEAERRIYASVN